MKLFLGLREKKGADYFHFPLIKIQPRPFEKSMKDALFHSSHVIFTSQSTVSIFHSYQLFDKNKKYFAIGEKTAEAISSKGFIVDRIAPFATQEGVCRLIEKEPKGNCYFWPRSSRSRNVLIDYFKTNSISYFAPHFYDTVLYKPVLKPELEQFEEIIFTSPSTVEAFFSLYDKIPAKCKMEVIGEITGKALEDALQKMGDQKIF